MFSLLASIAACSLFLPHEEKSFISWMRSMNQLYTGDEYQFRLCIFISNARLNTSHNSKNEDDLCAKIQVDPVAVAIDASNWSFQLYTAGIYDEPACSSSNLDHSVGCVGYGAEGNVKYRIVRNSWGSSWGERGYIRMIWNNNQCGIATMATLPTP